MYRINLARAVWRVEGGDAQPPEEAVPASPHDILYDKSGNNQIDSKYHGRAIRISGTVRGLHFAGEETAVKVECDGLLGIRERVESFEGECIVESSPGNGAKVTVKIKT